MKKILVFLLAITVFFVSHNTNTVKAAQVGSISNAGTSTGITPLDYGDYGYYETEYVTYYFTNYHYSVPTSVLKFSTPFLLHKSLKKDGRTYSLINAERKYYAQNTWKETYDVYQYTLIYKTSFSESKSLGAISVTQMNKEYSIGMYNSTDEAKGVFQNYSASVGAELGFLRNASVDVRALVVANFENLSSYGEEYSIDYSIIADDYSELGDYVLYTSSTVDTYLIFTVTPVKVNKSTGALWWKKTYASYDYTTAGMYYSVFNPELGNSEIAIIQNEKYWVRFIG